MFTLPDKLPHDDQLPALEYVFHLATLIEPFEDFYGSPLLERYISRYNTSATKSGLKKLDKLKARLNEFLSREEFGETLTFFEMDIEKFWHLLLFVYDFSYNQCTDGIKHISSLTALQTIIDKITENTELHPLQSPTFKEETKITFCIGKKKYTIEDCPTILRICSRLKEDVDTSDDWNWQNIKSYMKSETSESTSVLAYAFYLHFITFFNSYQSIISKRKIKDSPSKREKQLIGDLIFFTGIIQNESISTDPDYLKTLIKRYKDYQLPNGTFTY
ncbi:hypothetical protein PN569_16860 [Parabacteroides merdae]|nr:hypothetical protein [Parabacteroides merdae]MDB8968150.1 hypothetical protein [Parabacteroides merdae]MDB8971834.1 hypothetical protein [Parabacteroides merdae]MDB8975691.1 hypothetical protein [Parabacteroides merdae]MDB8979319.1 hypothetical protein [Parabacteroides merdae]